MNDKNTVIGKIGVDSGPANGYNKVKTQGPKHETAFRIVAPWLERKTKGEITLRFDGSGRVVQVEAREVF